MGQSSSSVSVLTELSNRIIIRGNVGKITSSLLRKLETLHAYQNGSLVLFINTKKKAGIEAVSGSLNGWISVDTDEVVRFLGTRQGRTVRVYSLQTDYLIDLSATNTDFETYRNLSGVSDVLSIEYPSKYFA